MTKIRWSVVARFAVIGGLWAWFCVWLVMRYVATGMELTLMNLLPIPISGAIIFIPLYKKYVKAPRQAADEASSEPHKGKHKK